MTNRRGFTLVELIVVIVVIAILATIATLGLNRYLEEGRDTRREANVTTISESLEKYFNQKGEYPSCSAITGPGEAVATDVLKGIDQSALLVPESDASTTNSIKCNSTLTINSTPDFIEYRGDGSSDCNGAGSCLSYKLRYKDESDNKVLEMNSRHTADIATSGVISNLDATATGFTTISIKWATVPNSLNYTLQRATNDAFTENLNTQTVSATNYTSSGLNAGVEYFYRVRPNANGQEGVWSNIDSDTTFALGTPLINATANSPSQITVSWSAVDYADSTTTYTVQQATNSTFTTGLKTVSGVKGTSQAFTGLTQGTDYYYRVQAKTTADTGDWSDYDMASTPVPGVPTLAVTVNSTSQATASWGSVSGASSYTIQQATNSTFSTGLSSTTGVTGTSKVYTGLSAGATYYYRIQAIVAGTTGAWSNVVARTMTPTAPTNVKATVNSATQYTISWSAVSGATSYKITYGSTSSASTYSKTTSATSLAITSSILQGTTHYFKVYAIASGAQSAASATVSGTTPINAPAAFNITSSHTSTSLTGSASAASCPSGTTKYVMWKANGSNWRSGNNLNSITYSLAPGQKVTLTAAVRCYKGSVTSSYRNASNSATYTRPGMNLTLTAGVDQCAYGFCGRQVNAKWNNVCGSGRPTITAKQLSATARWTADTTTSDSISWKGASSPGVTVTYTVPIGCTTGTASIKVISAYKCTGCS